MLRVNRCMRLIIICLFVLIIFSYKKVSAYESVNPNYQKNSNMTNKIGGYEVGTTFAGWHYSGTNGYWNFSYDDAKGTHRLKVTDSEAPTYFGGTYKEYNEYLYYEKDLPSEVVKFINIYGKDKLGIKFSTPNVDAYNGNKIEYELTDSSIRIRFKPVFRYDNNSIWKTNNSSIYNSMNDTGKKVCVPQVKRGYGTNYLSMGSGNWSIKLYPDNIKSSYYSGDWLYIINNDTGNVEKSNWNTFKNGGNNGVYFDFLTEITFYGMDVRTEGPNITKSQYVYKDDGVNWEDYYWVKTGERIELNQKGISSELDKVVKVNSNHIQINSLKGSSYINGKMFPSDQENTYATINNNVGISLLSGGSKRNEKELNSNYMVKVNEEEEYRLSGFSRLVNYENNNINDERIYKETPRTQEIVIQGDGTPPNIDGIPKEKKWNKYGLDLYLYSDDYAIYPKSSSGMKDIKLYESDNLLLSDKDRITYKNSKDGKYSYKVVARDNVSNTVTKTFNYNIDTKHPTASSIKIENITPTGFDIIVEGVTDNGGSGVDSISFNVWGEDEYIPDDNFTVEGEYKAEDKENGRWVYRYDNVEEGRYGKVKVEAYGRDKMGEYEDGDWNEGAMISTECLVPYPIPNNGEVIISKYDYKESESVYWVRPENNLAIYTDGYFDSSWGIYPSGTSVLFRKDNNSKNEYIGQNATFQGLESVGDKFYDHFVDYIKDIPDVSPSEVKPSGVSTKVAEKFREEYIVNGEKNIKNVTRNMHYLQAMNDRDNFRVYSRNSYTNSRYNTYESEVKDSGLWLRIDGQAPMGNCDISINRKTLDISININNLTDNGGSGVEKVYAKYKPIENDKVLSSTAIMDLTSDDEDKKTWRNIVNGYDLFKSERIKVEVYAVDNVGNERMLEEKYFDLFTVSARIVPYNKLDYVGDNPTLESGQKAVLIIETTGEPNQLRLSFHEELTSLDRNLDKNLDIKKEKYLETRYEFYVPLYSPVGEYDVNVKALRGSAVKEVNPLFKVDDNILNGIRTRLR